ncbi:uncharacterized protein METZ01_LOCUS215566 [marine metagenome]|uniref:Uncharacterized protein n=1 Tax=marine metagenome TaxID=408172 RepID=A0A382FJA4_9ZZZZ
MAGGGVVWDCSATVVAVGNDGQLNGVGRPTAEVNQIVDGCHPMVTESKLAERECASTGHRDLESMHLDQPRSRHVPTVHAPTGLWAVEQPPKTGSWTLSARGLCFGRSSRTERVRHKSSSSRPGPLKKAAS